VGYGEDVDVARQVIREAVVNCESISGPKSVEVFANEFADSSINFEIAWWTGATPVEIRRSRDEVIASIKSALDNAGIEIPFPYRTLTFADPSNVPETKQHSSALPGTNTPKKELAAAN
jgi:small-conductance mechanosensitive channel